MRVEVEQIDGRRLAVRARGVELIVDDTVEAGGPGDGFRPSELLMGALGACMIGTMVDYARNRDISVSNISMTLEDETAGRPERIAGIRALMRFETDTEERRRAALRRVAGACKIHKTLEHRPGIDLTFEVVG